MMKKIRGKSLAAAIMMSMAFSFTCAANTPEAAPVVPENAPAVTAEAAVPETAPVSIAPEASTPEVPVTEAATEPIVQEVAAPVTTTVAVQVEVQQPVVQEQKEFKAQGIVNWDKGPKADVEAIGVGLPPENAGQRGTALARRAAIVDAYRILAETVQGVQIDSETLVQDLVVADDLVKAKVNALVKGAHVVDEGVNEDGSYYVRMSIPMFGKEKSVAAVALPEVSKNVVPEPLPKVKETVLPKAEVKEIKKVKYTGVVVDADNMGLEATFAPVIYDTNGRIVYGLANLDKDKAISEGMVGYANVIQDATSGNRAGENPLVVKAVAVRGGKNSVNPVNVVVSVEDADKILLANENTQMLNAAAVVFVK